MKKQTFITLSILLCILIGCKVAAQKISKYNYKNVDSFFKYKNAEIIVYKTNSDKQMSDTIWFIKTAKEINIKIDVVNYGEINDEKILQKKDKK